MLCISHFGPRCCFAACGMAGHRRAVRPRLSRLRRRRCHATCRTQSRGAGKRERPRERQILNRAQASAPRASACHLKRGGRNGALAPPPSTANSGRNGPRVQTVQLASLARGARPQPDPTTCSLPSRRERRGRRHPGQAAPR